MQTVGQPNGFLFIESKYKTVVFSSKALPKANNDIFINNVELGELPKIKDFGIILDSALSFKQNITSIISKANVT